MSAKLIIDENSGPARLYGNPYRGVKAGVVQNYVKITVEVERRPEMWTEDRPTNSHHFIAYEPMATEILERFKHRDEVFLEAWLDTNLWSKQVTCPCGCNHKFNGSLNNGNALQLYHMVHANDCDCCGGVT